MLPVGSLIFTVIKISASQKNVTLVPVCEIRYISNFSNLKTLVSFDECKRNQYDYQNDGCEKKQSS